MNSCLIKISGAWLSGKNKPFDYTKYLSMAEVLKEGLKAHRTLSVVIGGGNVLRGKDFTHNNKVDETTDYIGILASIQNCLLMAMAIREVGGQASVIVPDSFSIPETQKFSEFMKTADDEYCAGKVFVFGGGIGIPGYSTDMAAVKIALWSSDQYIIFLKNGVVGLFDKNPAESSDAHFIRRISYHNYCAQKLKAIDTEAIELMDCGKGIKTYICECNPRVLRYLLLWHLEDNDVADILAGNFNDLPHYSIIED